MTDPFQKVTGHHDGLPSSRRIIGTGPQQGGPSGRAVSLKAGHHLLKGSVVTGRLQLWRILKGSLSG